jgi:hypothetical protein
MCCGCGITFYMLLQPSGSFVSAARTPPVRLGFDVEMSDQATDDRAIFLRHYIIISGESAAKTATY